MKFKLVQEYIDDFEHVVNQLLQNGWFLNGSPIVYRDTMLLQGMYKP